MRWNLLDARHGSAVRRADAGGAIPAAASVTKGGTTVSVRPAGNVEIDGRMVVSERVYRFAVTGEGVDASDERRRGAGTTAHGPTTAGRVIERQTAERITNRGDIGACPEV